MLTVCDLRRLNKATRDPDAIQTEEERERQETGTRQGL